MQGFISFLREAVDDGQGISRSRGKAPSGALKRTIIDPALEYAKEVASGVAADPAMFAKEYTKSLLTDPETYHSAFSVGGMVPGVGEPFDFADAALYAAQGDNEMAKLSLASTFPVVGAVGNVARVGRSAKMMEPMLKAERAVNDEISAWKAEKSGEYLSTISDPFFSQRFSTEVPATDNYKRLANEFGFLVPEVGNPTASLTPMEVLQGVYGKDAEKNVKLAKRAQEKYETGLKPMEGGSLKPRNPSEFVVPDYSNSSLGKKFNIYVGTHVPENLTGVIEPIVNAEAVTSQLLPRAFTINPASSAGPKWIPNLRLPFKDMTAHEMTHVLGMDNPKTSWPEMRDALTVSDTEYSKAWRDRVSETGGYVEPRFNQILSDPSFETKMPPHPNNEKIAKYFRNSEIPGQIAQAKAWMQQKGLPNVNMNMSYDEAKGLRDMILDKYSKGMFPEFKKDRTMPSIINILGSPQGKKLFDLIAKKEKGSSVNNKVQQMYA
jgi:hypothetical protein